MSMKAEMARAFARINKAEKTMKKKLENPPRGTGQLAPDLFTKKVRVVPWMVDGFYGVTINGSYTGTGHILMIPGGAYALEPTKRHREIAQWLAIEKRVRVSILPCPLAPEFTALAAHQFLLNAYGYLISQYEGNEFYLFGDSSGGGLALSFLQELKGLGTVSLPVRTAVVSPWLDLSLENPKVKIAKKADPLLPVEALKAVGERYRGLLPLDHPFVSPIHGDFHELGQILVFSGTDEIFTPDCELLAEKGGSLEGTKIIYKKGVKMVHDWILLPCKESEATLELISSFFLDENLEF